MVISREHVEQVVNMVNMGENLNVFHLFTDFLEWHTKKTYLPFNDISVKTTEKNRLWSLYSLGFLYV